MDVTPVISIIVPIYNVEKYLKKCIDSILLQTFKDFELILVDDGSPDKCPEICDEYALKDLRVSVIHKPNGGLSDARNKGIEIARGQYIGFVDSDDYIASDMYETLYNAAVSSNADISICNAVVVNENEAAMFSTDTSKMIMNRDQALMEMIYKKTFTVNAWNKLYRKELFESVRYPKGMLYEDLATTYRLISKANRIVYTPSEKYAYVQRQGSIMNNTGYMISADKVAIVNEMLEYFSCSMNEDKLFAGIIRYLINDIYKMASRGTLLNSGGYLLTLRRLLKETVKQVRTNKHLTVKEKIILKATRYFPWLLQELYLRGRS